MSESTDPCRRGLRDSLIQTASCPVAIAWSRYFLPAAYFILALPIVIFLAMFRQPIGVADEWSHIARADQIAHGTIFTESAKPGLPPIGSIDTAFLSLMKEVHKRSKEPLLTASRDFRKYHWSDERVHFNYNSSIYFPVVFLPTASVVTLGRAAGVPIIVTLRASSFLNGLLCLLSAAAAILIARRGRIMIFAVAMLPMSLNQFASSSPDGPLIASSLILCAMLAKSIESRRLSVRTLSVATILATIVSATKLPYLFLALSSLAGMWLAADVERPKRQILVICIICAIAVSVGWAQITNSGSVDVSWGAKLGDPARQVEFLLSNPSAIITVAIETIKALGLSYLGQMVGYLGWQDAPISLAGQIFFVALLSVVALQDGATLHKNTRFLIAGGIGFSMAAIFFAVYVSMVKVGSMTPIIGVQGRYFLPILPFLAMLSPLVPNKVLIKSELVCLVFIGSIVANVEIVNAIIHRYYL